MVNFQVWAVTCQSIHIQLHRKQRLGQEELLLEVCLVRRRASSASSSSILMPSIPLSFTFGAAAALLEGALSSSCDSLEACDEFAFEVSPHAIRADSALRFAMSGSICSAISSDTCLSSFSAAGLELDLAASSGSSLLLLEASDCQSCCDCMGAGRLPSRHSLLISSSPISCSNVCFSSFDTPASSLMVGAKPRKL